jgi:hypothetical protein
MALMVLDRRSRYLEGYGSIKKEKTIQEKAQLIPI